MFGWWPVAPGAKGCQGRGRRERLFQDRPVCVYPMAMEGVTTAAVVFIFVCIAFPRMIRRRTQYYGAVAAVLLILLLGCLDRFINHEGFHRFFGVMMYLLDFAAVLLLIMCCGGLSPKELFGQMGDAFQELR